MLNRLDRIAVYRAHSWKRSPVVGGWVWRLYAALNKSASGVVGVWWWL
jgi:hypothetical protein